MTRKTSTSGTGSGPAGGDRSGVLRLDEAGGTGNTAAARLSRRMTREDVRRANRAAATLTPEDARLIMAARVAESLQGGKAAVLRPEQRLNLVRLATRLGIRPFDANLIIAIVQDSARRGETLADVEAQGRLAPIPHPALAAQRRHSRRFWARVRTVVAAVCIAAMVLVWLTNWIGG